MRAVLGLACALSVAACSTSRPPDSPSRSAALGFEWSPVDSLEAGLPPSVRVWAGVSARDTLRAWAVRLGPGVALEVEVAAGALETPSAFARRTGACVVLNGGYFNVETGAPVGLVVDDGRLVAGAFETLERGGLEYPVARGAVGIGGGVEVATARDDGAAACRASVGNRRGAPGGVSACRPWPVREALGAGPVLVRDGRVEVGTEAEVFFGTAIPDRHPRSAVGVLEGGAVVLVVVDGRQPASRGVTLEELAALMVDLGARDALNLDGGGSSALVVRPRGRAPVRLNLPTGYDVERPVATALAARCE